AESIVAKALPASRTTRVNSITARGPLEEKYDARFFRRAVPNGGRAQRWYAERMLKNFAEKAFRGPVDEETVGRLVELAIPSPLGEEKDFAGSVRHGGAGTLTPTFAKPTVGRPALSHPPSAVMPKIDRGDLGLLRRTGPMGEG